jgi:hypothetical protein
VPLLVLGPVLRYVGETEATIWVETDAPATLEVLGTEEATFEVAGRHYALLRLRGLEPGTTTPYELRLDGERVWPEEGSSFPPPAIRTLERSGHVRLLFGSCRVSRPHEPPFTLGPTHHEEGFDRDALYAYALRMREQPPEEWPHLMFWAGDQVYADELPPDLLDWVRARRRRGIAGPEDEAGTLEEYVALYHAAWSEPAIRWFLSTVSNAMIFDDHDVHDDWNTSQAWVEGKKRDDPFWASKLEAALGSYWLYQHAGNLEPSALERDETFRGLGAGDNWPVLQALARQAERGHDGARWSYCRALGTAKLLVMDSRGGRVLDEGARAMLDDAEWRWIESEAHGDVDHLLLGTSLPFLLAPALHDLESWNEAVCGGVWGARAARLSEKLRQGMDLEHWAAFETSFRALAGLVGAIARGERGEPPATIVALSGDVHHAYVAEVGFPRGTGARSRVYQAVCSPVRNPLSRKERTGIRGLRTKPAVLVARALARAAGVKAPPIRWRELGGPYFANQIASLDLHGREATIRLEEAGGGREEEPTLACVYERAL